MTCKKVRKLLSERHDGELAPDVDAALAGHLDGCAACRQVADAHREMMALLAQAERPELPADFAAVAHRRLVAERARGEPAGAARRSRWLVPFVRGGALVGAGALAMALFVGSRGGEAAPAQLACEPVATTPEAVATTPEADADLPLGEIAMVTLTLEAPADHDVEVEVVLPDGLSLVGEGFDALPEKVVTFTTTHRGGPIRIPVRADRPGTWLVIAHARTGAGEVTSETRLHVPTA